MTNLVRPGEQLASNAMQSLALSGRWARLLLCLLAFYRCSRAVRRDLKVAPVRYLILFAIFAWLDSRLVIRHGVSPHRVCPRDRIRDRRNPWRECNILRSVQVSGRHGYRNWRADAVSDF
jgi:hypothetical protein